MYRLRGRRGQKQKYDFTNSRYGINQYKNKKEKLTDLQSSNTSGITFPLIRHVLYLNTGIPLCAAIVAVIKKKRIKKLHIITELHKNNFVNKV